MHRPLYFIAEFFSRPPGFYVMLAAGLACAVLASATLGTYIVSISALALTALARSPASTARSIWSTIP